MQETHNAGDQHRARCRFAGPPAEGQIFVSICQGKSLTQAADALGIAKSTAKTHLTRVFDKTGCKRQAELVTLAARLSPTL